MEAANDNRPAVLDLFSGIGGFSLGLERAGLRTAAFCEIDDKACAVLAKHWPTVPIFNDVKTLTKRALDERGIAIDIICGGFPCQDISAAGRGAGLSGERSGLWWEFHRLIEEIRPQFAIIENVSLLRSRGLDQVLGSLAALGYDAEWHCIPASAVGAPHRRDRVWIVSYPNGSRPHAGAHSRVHRGEAGAGARNGEPERLRGPRGEGVVADSPRIIERVSPAGWWGIEPGLGRMAHGVPCRVDRLRQLGNSVVPQIPEMIGRAILSKFALAANDNAEAVSLASAG